MPDYSPFSPKIRKTFFSKHANLKKVFAKTLTFITFVTLTHFRQRSFVRRNYKSHQDKSSGYIALRPRDRLK